MGATTHASQSARTEAASRLCKHCSAVFHAHDKRRKFCSLTCCWQWRRENKDKLKGAFTANSVPWNLGTKGVMKANAGTFRKGCNSSRVQPVGTIRVRTTAKDGGPRAFIKVSDNRNPSDWKPLAVFVWESHHGPLPKGSVVHHKDRNTLNDSIDNLQAMTRSEHLEEHRFEHAEQRAAGLRASWKKRKEAAT